MITVGNKTTSGGFVISGSSNVIINGKMIALIGDTATCPCGKKICRGLGPIIAQSPRAANVSGENLARVGDLVDTGCGSCFIDENSHQVNLGISTDTTLNMGSGVNMGNGINANNEILISDITISRPFNSTSTTSNTSIETVIKRKHLEIKSMTSCAKNTLFPQLPLPDDVICTLSKLHKDTYLITPINGDIPKIPTGNVDFVILAETPLKVLCFEKNEVYSRKELRDRAQGVINYGHSSLAYIDDGIKNAFDKKYSLEDRIVRSTKPVLLAGTMVFPEHDIPALDGGKLLSWSNDSGHFKPTNEQAIRNRIGPVKDLLSIDKYKPFSSNDGGQACI